MAITKAEILTELNNRLSRSATNIDKELTRALYRISRHAPLIFRWVTISLSAGQAGYDLRSSASGFSRLAFVTIDGGSPLAEITSFQDYKAKAADETSGEYDEPSECVVEDRILYFHSTPDDDYSATLFYWSFDYNPDGIELDIDFKEVLTLRTMYEYLKLLGMEGSQKGLDILAEYREELKSLVDVWVHAKAPKCAQYRDI